LAVEWKKPFLDCIHVFPVIVMRRVAAFRKKTTEGSFFRATTLIDDYGKTIGDIEKRFFAFNCQLKKLKIKKFCLFSSDYRFTGNRRFII
jgi:hypothetical protein